uniref:Uncharacterized protein n=1 Tax=viral metagenome TaxID=1070528 RepID=A0A6C0CMX6_9ZZZZ
MIKSKSFSMKGRGVKYRNIYEWYMVYGGLYFKKITYIYIAYAIDHYFKYGWLARLWCT